MKVCYTCLFSNYEDLKQPRVITPGWRYICYTDQDLKSDIWEIKQVVEWVLPAQMLARYYKIIKWMDWEQSIWVDASFIIDTNLDDWWKLHCKGSFSAPGHPLRNDVYQECMDCIISKRGNREEVDAQMNKYKKLGIPSNNGLITSGILMRENTANVIQLCGRWWDEVKNHSIRDQIAFCRVSIGADFVHMYNWDYRKEKDFIYRHHYNRR